MTVNMKINKIIIKNRCFIDHDGKQKSRFGYRGKNTIQWIVIHYTGTPTANGNAEKFAKKAQVRKQAVSTHYFVGDDGVFQIVEEYNAAWHVGGYKKENKLPACNATSIGVDLVEHKKNTKSGIVKDCDWYFTEKVLVQGASLVAALMKKYNIPLDHVVRHFDVTGKACPRPFVGDDINLVNGESHNFAWRMFLARIEIELERDR